MKVFGVNGSGRAGGNTAVLVDGILRGAADSGAETEMLELAGLTIAGCNACNACKETQKCVIDDDMSRFYGIAAETDVIVLASPVYLDHVSSQLMAFIQRFYCYLGLWPEKYWPRTGAKAVAAITYGAGNLKMYDYVLDWMAGRMKGYFNVETLERFKIASTQHSLIIDADHDEVRRAYEFGKTLSDA